MSHMDQVSFSTIKCILEKIFSLDWLKAISSASMVMYSFLFNEPKILIAVYVLIAIDTATGFAKAIKEKSVSSGAFFRVAMKCLIYFILIATGRLVDMCVPIPFASPIMESFLVITEALSIMENISQLGFPVPLKLVKVLKIFQDKGVKIKKK